MLRKEDFEPNMKTEDKIPGAQTENPAQSQRFGDFIVKYMQNVQDTMELFSGGIFLGRSMKFSGFFMFPLEKYGRKLRSREPPIIRSRNVIPTWIWRQQGNPGINRLHDHPYLKLRGKGYCGGGDRFRGLIIRNEVFSKCRRLQNRLFYGISP